MYLIDSDGATNDNRFTDGDSVLGTPATVLPAEYLNMLQDELQDVIVAAGIELDKGANDQLLAALTALGLRSATTTLRGVVELSTIAEAIAGEDAIRAVTSAGVQAKVSAEIDALKANPPETLDTLDKLAQAIGDDPNFATTVALALATKETPAGAQAKVDAHANTFHMTSVTDNVAILTGTIGNGGTIPLPAGYTEGQCKWQVGLGNCSVASPTTSIECYVSASRVVTVRRYLQLAEPETPGWSSDNMTANYIIIGVK